MLPNALSQGRAVISSSQGRARHSGDKMIARSLLTQSGAKDVKIFYSYSRRDDHWRRELDRLLPQYNWDVAVRTWYDGEIEPGTEWRPEIDHNLQAADIILLFVGQAFVESLYCREVELPAALGRHAKGEARVVPVILETTNPDWRTLGFAHLQVLPQNAVPVTAWNDRTRALEAVVQGLVDLVVHQGLHHQPRLRWELHLEGSAAEFTQGDRLGATTQLRHITGDETLRCVDVGNGSTVLTMESTQDAAARARRSFEANELPMVGRRHVLRIVQLFGAAIRASSTIADFTRPRHLPPPEHMLLPSRAFAPTLMKGLECGLENPLQLHSIIDNGDSGLTDEAFVSESQKLLEDFMTLVAIPEHDVYVNLSPDEDARLLADSLKGTRIGATLLEFDLRLKRLSASLLHPDLEPGRAFWKAVLGRVQDRAIPDAAALAAFQRVWIVPDKAVVYEGTSESIARIRRGEPPLPDGGLPVPPCAFVVEHRLKAMTERQYLGGRGHGGTSDPVASICDEVFRELILPIIEREVNEGETFAENRQLCYCLVLATWFKLKYKDHPEVAKFIDSGLPEQLVARIQTIQPWGREVEGPDTSRLAVPPSLSSRDWPSVLAAMPSVERVRASASYQILENREYYERYLDIFADGVFYAERDELIQGQGLKRPRAYLAGAIDMRTIGTVLRRTTLFYGTG